MRRLLLSLTMTVTLLMCATAGAKTITVAPGGNLTTAYNQAAAGDAIELSTGRYGRWITPTGSKAVTVRAATGQVPKLTSIDVEASNLTFDGLDIDGEGGKLAGFYTGDGDNVTFKNGRIGNIVDDKGALLTANNPTFDNVDFHDVKQVGADVHNECIQTFSPGLTIRNSRFTNCATMDVSIGTAGYWNPPQPQYGHITLENNVFGHSTNGSGWHYYGLAWWMETLDYARVVNNTFENMVIMDRAGPSKGGVWANNIGGGWDCVSGVVYTGNVGTKCSSKDKAVSPSSSCAPSACSPAVAAPMGWLNPGKQDFHLTANSPAIDAGDAVYAPVKDLDGKGRSGTPDAGAYEYQGTTTPPPPPLPPADTTAPETTITTCPRDGTATDATIAFGSEPGATFECKLDAGAWSLCTSIKSYTGLAVATHTFEVRATDLAGNTDQTPATASWTITAPATPPACDQTTAERDQALADLAVMTDSRDAWKARAQKAEDQLSQIQTIVGG
jgi:hypothetical protein